MKLPLQAICHSRYSTHFFPPQSIRLEAVYIKTKAPYAALTERICLHTQTVDNFSVFLSILKWPPAALSFRHCISQLRNILVRALLHAGATRVARFFL